MALGAQELAELADYVLKLSPGTRRHEVDDIVQDALVRAQQRVGNGDIVGAAKEEVPALLDERRWRAARGETVAGTRAEHAEGSSEPSAFAPRRRARSRDPHTPKGLVRRNREGGETDYLPLEVGDPPTADQQTMAARLAQELLMPVLRGEPVSPEHAKLLANVYRQGFGHAPEHLWAEILVDELGKVVRAGLAEQAGPNPPGKLAGNEAIFHLKPTPAALERDPNLPPILEVRAERRLISVNGDKAVFGLFGQVFGEEQLLMYDIGTFVDGTAEPLTIAPNPDRARVVVLNTIVRVNAMPNARPLPDWVLDVELLELLIERRGFEGGGGRKKLSGARLVELLVEPGALAADIEAFGARYAERADDAGALRWAERCGELARRLRAAVPPCGGESSTD